MGPGERALQVFFVLRVHNSIKNSFTTVMNFEKFITLYCELFETKAQLLIIFIFLQDLSLFSLNMESTG